MLNGVINVYKEQGFTSHDVVAKLRGICKQKKIGHTGTLDPMAEGVLPVCLGNATKLCDLLTDKRKEYVAELLLGKKTDTQDVTGNVLFEKELSITEDGECVNGISCSEIRKVMEGFIGKGEQIPPMYSALKVNGQKLYDLARAGIEVERKPRPIEIYELNILDISLPVIKFRVVCSKGTYVRTICEDIGEKLGLYGTMKSLLRTKVERFCIDEALTLSQIEAYRDEDKLAELVLPVDQIFEHTQKLFVKKEFQKLIDNGNPFYPEQSTTGEIVVGEWVRVYNEDEQFYGVYEYREEQKRYKPVKLFLNG